ncbi:MAG: alanine--tRNA ligase [Bacteriovoracaceae bacterium]|jgi:alanyl-tRNA synthetase|nr:alanine--tRNA ligase [Bacteriovoracaceae bacterium]
MKAQEIRDRFTKYFENNKHEIIDSSPLVPQNDPTLLFANAGMNQFKDYFTGAANPKNKRATTIQKCVRAGGKHNDLENVGFTARHHTFFEMLGNFSFGDYFKTDAIKFAWTFLTEDLKIPKDKLYITVHDSDQDAFDIWNKEIGIEKDRIFYMGDKDNFWEMGDIGPCGPCSEIFYDHGPEYSDGTDTSKCLLADESRYIEIWNLVFMQYEKYKEGDEIKRKPLPKPSVDTGAGLERIAALMQGVYWNYDSDVFAPILNSIATLSGKKYDDTKYQGSFRVVADHIRAATMLISDGVIPSNEGRGYVLRRIIRRAIRHLEELGLKEVSFYKLIPAVIESLGKQYHQLSQNVSLCEKLLKLEEEKFRQTLRTGLDLINKEIKRAKTNTFSGVTAFKLYDTYGFPLDLTELILEENNLKLNLDEFNEQMKKQKESSKKKSNFSTNEGNEKEFYVVKEKFGDTVFTGYNSLEENSTLQKIISLDNNTHALFFDKSPFYSESGGQAGDEGAVLLDGNTIANIIDTQSPVAGINAHFVKLNDITALKEGSTYTLKVDSFSRSQTAKHHSATHLLQAALIEVLGDHVKQAGSSVRKDSLRFDFTQPERIPATKLDEVEKLVNAKINESLNIECLLMSKEEAQAKGAMALFGEKYHDEVRVLKMGDFSLELCGGTHVSNTNEISIFKILSESSLSSGIRRIEAVVSNSAINYLMERSKILNTIESGFSVKNSQVLDKIESLQNDLKDKNSQIKALQEKIQAQASKDLFNDLKDIGKDFKLACVELKDANPKDFRSMSDKFLDKNPNDVLFIYSLSGDKSSYLLRCSKKNSNVHCSNIIKANQEIVTGKGGGKPDMAQGSGVSKNFSLFLEKIETSLKEL